MAILYRQYIPPPQTGGWDSHHCLLQRVTWTTHPGSVITCVRPLMRCLVRGTDESQVGNISDPRSLLVILQLSTGSRVWDLSPQWCYGKIYVCDALCLILVSTLWGRQNSYCPHHRWPRDVMWFTKVTEQIKHSGKKANLVLLTPNLVLRHLFYFARHKTDRILVPLPHPSIQNASGSLWWLENA